MKIEILPHEFLELADALGRNGKPFKGWVSHPVSTNNPPCVMTTATTADDHETAADDHETEEEVMERARDFASHIIRNLLDFEGWLDMLLRDGKDIGRVRFFTEMADEGHGLTLLYLLEYKNPDRRKTPRRVSFIGQWIIPENTDIIADTVADIVCAVIDYICDKLGLSHDDYLKWLGHSDDLETFKDE